MANEFKIKNGITIDDSSPASGIVTDLTTATETDLVTGSGIKDYVDTMVGGGGNPSVGAYGDIDAANGAGGWYNTNIHVNESGVDFPGSEVRLFTNDENGVLKLYNAVDDTSDSIIELSPTGIYINNTVNGSDPVVDGDFVTKSYADTNYSTATQGQGLSLYLGNSGVTGGNFNLTTEPEVLSGVVVETSVDSTTTPVFIERFVTEGFNTNILEAGKWNFDSFFSIDSSVGTSKVTIRVNKSCAKVGTLTSTGTGLTRTFTATEAGTFVAGDANASILLATLIETPTETFWIDSFTSGTEVTALSDNSGYTNETAFEFRMYYILFSVQTDDINGTDPRLYPKQTVQPEYVIDTTDEILLAYFAETTSVSSRTISLYKNGDAFYSHVDTPLLTSHNSLKGLNDGDYQHLTAAEKSAMVTSLDGLSDVDITTPTSGEMLTYDGSNWTNGEVSTGGLEYAHLKDIKSTGTNAGTMTAGAWRTRVLNDLDTNITGVSLSSNQFTLPAGTYMIDASAPGVKIAYNQAKLYNVTDTSDVLLGASLHTEPSQGTTTFSRVMGTFTITSSKVFELQHKSSGTYADYGLGIKSNTGSDEIYAQIALTKIA